MNEHRKEINWKMIIAVAMLGLLVFILYQIAVLKDDIDNLKYRNSTLSAQVQTLRDEIHSVYDNVDDKLKEQASLVAGVDFQIGDISDDMKSVELALTVVPKLAKLYAEEPVAEFFTIRNQTEKKDSFWKKLFRG